MLTFHCIWMIIGFLGALIIHFSQRASHTYRCSGVRYQRAIMVPENTVHFENSHISFRLNNKTIQHSLILMKTLNTQAWIKLFPAKCFGTPTGHGSCEDKMPYIVSGQLCRTGSNELSGSDVYVWFSSHINWKVGGGVITHEVLHISVIWLFLTASTIIRKWMLHGWSFEGMLFSLYCTTVWQASLEGNILCTAL